MIITRDTIIEQIADQEDIDIATVRTIFDAMEYTTFSYLSSVAPNKPVSIKLLNGLKIKGEYVSGKTYNKGMFKNINSSDKIKIKPIFTHYYKQKLNKCKFN